MPDDVRAERFLIGLHGLALLRQWPFGDAEVADRELARIAELATGDDERHSIDFLDTLDAYADWSEVYEEPNALILAEESALRPILEDLPAGWAIDVACGTGRVSTMLAELGHEVTSVDPSPEMLRKACARGIAATFIEGDLAAIPADDSTFDLATCALALTHVEDLRPAIAELARVVKRGGRVVLSDIHPIAAATGGHAGFKREDGTRGITRNHVHWPSDYLEAFNTSGLVIERCEEPRFSEPFLTMLGSDEVRDAARFALVGLPFALVWQLRRT